MMDIASDFDDIAIGRQNVDDAHHNLATASPATSQMKTRGPLPGSPFPPSPSRRWYAGAIAVGLASAMAVAFGLNAITTPKYVAVAKQDGASETVVVKTDRAQPLPVRTIPIVPSPLVAPPIIVPPPAPVAPPTPAPSTLAQIEPTLRAHADICARHGGHRVDTGRSWHCAYPKRAQ
jgi:uncharacterized RDD family membrane protein YckC